MPQRWIAAGATVTRFDWKVTVLLVQASGAEETIRPGGRRGGPQVCTQSHDLHGVFARMCLSELSGASH